jgi:hypothetical protein
MRKLLFIAAIFTANFCSAQVSTSDCEGATVLCGDLYTEDSAPPGTGNIYEFTGSCNQNLETMSLWYTFTVFEEGDLSFILTPNVLQDDYDWGLFDVTNGGCDGIGTGASPAVSCNSWGSLLNPNGPTGISTANGGVSNVGGPGDQFGPPFNANLPVIVGQTYALVVMNWSNSDDGYTIDFGESSASLFEQEPPTPVALTKNCNSSQLLVTFSELVISETAEDLDFTISGPQGTFQINNVLPLSVFGSLEDQFVLTPAVNITQPGTYTLEITNESGSISDPCGNLAIGAIDIIIPESIAYETATSTACNGDGGAIEITNLQGGVGEISFYLNDILQTEFTVSDLPSGNYVVSIRDEEDCIVNTQIQIPDQQITVEIPSQDTLSCALPLLEIQGVLVSPVQDVTYQWDIMTPNGFESIGSTIINPSLADSGLYQLTISNLDNGCSAQAQVTIIGIELNNMSFDALVSGACNSIGGMIEVQNIVGGNSVYTIELNGEEQSSNLFSELVPGNYLVTVFDGNNCSVSEEFEIPNNEISVFIPEQNMFTCAIDSIEIEGVSIQPQQNVTANWFLSIDDELFNTGYEILNPVFDSAGEYVLVIQNEISGCDASASIILNSNVPENFSFEYEITNACNGEFGIIEITSINEGAEPFSIFFDNELQTGLTLSNLPNGEFEVSIIDQNLCESTINVMVPNHILNVEIPEQDFLTCDIQELQIANIQISPSQPVIYEWLYYDPLQGYVSIDQPISNPTISIPGIYRVIVSTEDGLCGNADAMEIFYSNENNITYNTDIIPACNGVNGTFALANLAGGTPPYVYSFNGEVQPNYEIQDLLPGSYSIEITDGHDCVSSAVIMIPNNLLDIYVPAQDKLTCQEPSVELGGIDVIPDQEVHFTWAYETNDQYQVFNEGDETPVVSNIGMYQITVTNLAIDCRVTEFFIVEAGALYGIDHSHIRFPNIITPNKDSKNESWGPFLDFDSEVDLISLFDIYELKIFNRWGNLIFDSTASNAKRWTVQEEEDGTYFYTVKYRSSCGGIQESQREGTIQIMR